MLFVLEVERACFWPAWPRSYLARLLPDFPCRSISPGARWAGDGVLPDSGPRCPLSGLAPALKASKADIVAALKDDGQAPVDRLRLAIRS